MLSIIVPVYNTSATLERCVESICSQSLHYDWELLLIDDGSTDGSGQMCDEMAANNPRIRVFHQANAGLSEARNTGIRNAKGELITFVDSDDYLGANTLRPNYEIMLQHPEVDILEYSVKKELDTKEEYINFDDVCYTDVRDYWLSCKAYEHTYACNKIFRSQLFQKVMFPSGRIFEDAWFMPQLLKLQPRVLTSSKGYYCYVWNDSGITSNASTNHLRQLLEAQLKALELLGITLGKDVGAFLQDSRVGALYLHLLNLQISAYVGDDESIILPFYRVSFRQAHSLKSFIKVLLLNTLGINSLCRIINH